jgi:hypothetical protein
MDAAGGWSSELAYAALAAITAEPIGQLGGRTPQAQIVSIRCFPLAQPLK